MKHFTFWKSLLLLCALVVGSSSVWAQDPTVTITISSFTDLPTSGNASYALRSWTADGVSGKGQICANSSSPSIQMNGGNANGKIIYNTTEIPGNIKNINLIKASGSNRSYSVYGRTTAYTSDDGTNYGTLISTANIQDGNGRNYTVTSGSYNYFVILNASSNAAYLSSITISYEVDEKTDPTITFDNGSVRVGKTLDLSTLFDSDSEGVVTYSITEGGSYATLSGSTLTGTAVGSVTVKAEQAAAGAYNAGEATATITVNAALTLSSIAITTAPTKTTYTEGETFDATGMVVTATYSDSSTDDVTESCTWTPNGALTIADDKITVSYTENATTKTAELAITVNAYLQPTSVSISLNNTFFGCDAFTNYAANSPTSYTGTKDNVEVAYAKGTGSGFYCNTNGIRLYSGGSLTFTAPANYVIRKIVFTGDSGFAEGLTNPDGTATWEGNSASVEITGETKTGSTRKNMTGATVTLAPTATIAANKEWITYTSKHDLDFTEAIDGLDGAYTITGHSNGATTLTATKMAGTVMAGTGLLLHAAAVDTKNAQVIVIPVAESGTEQTGNMLVGVTVATTVNPTDDAGNTTNLGLKNGSFVPYSAAGTLAAGKAYLQIPTADMPSNGAKLTIVFGGDGETTNINLNVNDNLDQNAPRYNMAGQRVSDSYKGIVIVNGKKYINK